MNFEQPKPDSKKYSDLINEIQKGIIKIPKFQREFVWSIDKTAKLLDSILKGYSTHIKVTFPVYDDVQICHIRVAQSSKPVFVTFEGKEDFFVRSGCSSQPLSREDQSAYEKEHWGA